MRAGSQPLTLWLVTFVAGTLGVCLGGALMAFLVSERGTAIHTARPGGSAVPHRPIASAAGRNESLSLLKHLHGRLAKLEAQAPAESPENPSMEVPPPKPLSPEQSRERSIRVANEQNSRFASEAIDADWAGDAARTLQENLGAAAAAGNWSSASVECRTAMCKGTLRWPTYHLANDSLMTLLTTQYTKNCAVTVTLPQPDNADASYEGNIFFDCSEDRAR